MEDEKSLINVEKISYRLWEKHILKSIQDLKSKLDNYFNTIANSQIMTFEQWTGYYSTEDKLDALFYLGEYYTQLYTYLEVLHTVNKNGKRKYSYFFLTYDDGSQMVRHKLKSLIKEEKDKESNYLTYR